MKNKRLEWMLGEVLPKSGLGQGRYLLDLYMGRTIRSDVSHTITTRTAEDNNTYVMEIWE